MVTHDLLGAAEVADRIGFLDQGRITHEFCAGSDEGGDARFDVRALYRRYAGTHAARQPDEVGA
jgi:ABC-2 type transport system ATP-binding protein